MDPLFTGWTLPESNPSGSSETREQLRSSFQASPFHIPPTPPGNAQYIFPNQGQAINSSVGHQTRPIFPPQHGVQLPYETGNIAISPGNPQPGPHVVAANAARDKLKTRRARCTAPPDEEWARHKTLIEDLYMIRNLSLPQTKEAMREQYRFKATDKMYKEKFKLWKWSKYLPKGKAGWMMNKVNQRKPCRTEFQYGNQTWTEERVKRAYDRMAADKVQLDEAALDAPTPAGLTYATPAQHPETPSATSQTPLYDPSSAARTPSRPAVSQDRFAERLVRPHQQYLSLQDLDKLVVDALRADVRGENPVAEDKLLDAIAGFNKALSSTDGRTIKVSYMLSVSYANQQRMDQADEVLNWLTSSIVERWGRRHHRTLVHFLAVVDLLQSWERHEHAQVILHKIFGSWDEIEDGRPLDIPSNNTGIGLELAGQDDLANAQAEIFQESSDAGEVDMQLRVAKFWTSANVDGVEEILRRLIAQCDKYPEKLAVQAIQARCSFAQWHISQGSRKDARPILKPARSSLERHIGEQDKVDKQLLDLSCRLAFLYLDAGCHAICDDILERAAYLAERRLMMPLTQNTVDLAVGLHISIGLDYQQRSSWSQARPWYERALALEIRLRGPNSSTAERLAKSLEEKRFQFTSLDSVGSLINPGLIRGFCYFRGSNA